MRDDMAGRHIPARVEEQQSEGVLNQVVKNASVYTPMKVPGSLLPAHLFPPYSTELVLLTLPDEINPMSLINHEVVVGGRKDSLLLAGEQRYRVTTYSVNQENTCLPSLFLPDHDGQLTKVTSDIKAFLVVKGEVGEKEEEGKDIVDIEALRSNPCKVPKHIKQRDFLAQRRKPETLMDTNKKVKRKKKSVAGMPNLDVSYQSNGREISPSKKRRSKTLHS